MRRGTLPVCVALVAGAFLSAPASARGDTSPADRARAMNVVPPGESGFTNLLTFSQVAAGLAKTDGPHTADQVPLYAGWAYKAMQFTSGGTGVHPGGNASVTVTRDAFGVPRVDAGDERSLAMGIGYAMAQDRLFQMEIFRRVGHGTLAQLIGPAGLPMDEAVRRATEGPAGRAAELAAQPQDVRDRLSGFGAGVNQAISEAMADPTRLPVEFALFHDVPIATWTDDDTLAFGEYAGRFFGEFGQTEIAAARVYIDQVAEHGQAAAERTYGDLFPLNDPLAPVSIPPASGLFPRHVGPPVAASYPGSIYPNHDPAIFGDASGLHTLEVRATAAQKAVELVQRLVGVPRFGSNAILVSGSRTADGNPMLYGGPQTGFAAPGYFWEVELHDPQRDQRGVMVPAVPLMVIGRNADAAWTVTSGLDANSDAFIEQLDSSNAHYVHNGQTLAVQEHDEAIPCNNPPTDVTTILGNPGGGPPALCPLSPDTIHIFRTVHGAGIEDPDAGHHLYVHQSAVDNQILNSFAAWDNAGRQHDAGSFFAALQPMALCFNFFYADAHGDIGYYHVGKLPIRPANADPNLPMPGTGAYDWQGYESFDALPHVINPAQGYIVNWNNKPAAGWWSKSTKQESAAANVWAEQHQVVPLDAAVRSAPPLTIASLGQVPRVVAYIDNPARILLPFLIHALQGTADAQLAVLLPKLIAWDRERSSVSAAGTYTTPAVVFTDRFVEHALAVVLGSVLDGHDEQLLAGLLPCPSPPCHLQSVDNLDTPTYKWELNAYHTLLKALEQRTSTDFLAGAGPDAAVLRAAHDTAAELTAAQGADPNAWNEKVDAATWSAQGAVTVPPVTPLPNRGSYGQVVEPLATGGSITAAAGAASPGVGLTSTAPGGAPAGAASLASLLAISCWAAARRRPRRAPAVSRHRPRSPGSGAAGPSEPAGWSRSGRRSRSRR